METTSRMRRALLRLALLGALPAPALAAAHELQAPKPPPSADLEYAINAQVKGLALGGTGLIQWRAGQGRYRLSFESRSMLLGTILLQTSDGLLEDGGLAPLEFTLKRFRKDPITTGFDRTAKQANFAGRIPPVALQGDEQDRLSVLWQLVAVARANPARFVSGTRWTFRVVEHRATHEWTFDVKDAMRLRTPAGEFGTLHVARPLEDNPKAEQQMEMWLAPDLDWLPVQVRLSEKSGDYIEQTLERLVRK